jgi:hypothetical protein
MTLCSLAFCQISNHSYTGEPSNGNLVGNFQDQLHAMPGYIARHPSLGEAASVTLPQQPTTNTVMQQLDWASCSQLTRVHMCACSNKANRQPLADNHEPVGDTASGASATCAAAAASAAHTCLCCFQADR